MKAIGRGQALTLLSSLSSRPAVSTRKQAPRRRLDCYLSRQACNWPHSLRQRNNIFKDGHASCASSITGRFSISFVCLRVIWDVHSASATLTRNMRGNKFATDIIHHAAVITNHCPESGLSWLKYVNAECLGGGKRKRREEGRKCGEGSEVGGSENRHHLSSRNGVPSTIARPLPRFTSFHSRKVRALLTSGYKGEGEIKGRNTDTPVVEQSNEKWVKLPCKVSKRYRMQGTRYQQRRARLKWGLAGSLWEENWHAPPSLANCPLKPHRCVHTCTHVHAHVCAHTHTEAED